MLSEAAERVMGMLQQSQEFVPNSRGQALLTNGTAEVPDCLE
jgi:hypothetical protein